ncbi:alcohol dehydrogenase catalytic domain-containing protein [Streptomyces sp. MA5143a]|uniref:alcohol dehydrogenase catalytic domain-containing protein n=1 Tax=Streptomyces sp. MA5143a TaxID=2083010 RepID=UPI0021594B76|nr:alcohol dehydrogenase catalytic domain-containing protein [Streptomyces sp. MA5143a]
MEKVTPGDHVAVSFLPCGRCRPCLDGSPASCAHFNAVNFAGQRPDGSHALRPADGDGTSTTGSSASRPSPPTPSPTNATPSRCGPTPHWHFSDPSAAASRPAPERYCVRWASGWVPPSP